MKVNILTSNIGLLYYVILGQDKWPRIHYALLYCFTKITWPNT